MHSGALVRKITHWGRAEWITFCYERQMLDVAEAIGLLKIEDAKAMGKFVVSQSLRDLDTFFAGHDEHEQTFAAALAKLK